MRHIASVLPGKLRSSAVAMVPQEEATELMSQLRRWQDFNRTWMDVNLGGSASAEYAAAVPDYVNVWVQSVTRNNWGTLRGAIGQEISQLESVRDRLPLWVVSQPEAVASADQLASRSSAAPIFIVHGSDTLRAESVARTVETATSRKTIILRDQPNLGRTLLEKFEQNAAEASYAIIVLTADDKGGRADDADVRPRGRQNVIFEMGYFFGLIGRNRVSVLLRPGVEKPSDMDGIAYITFDDERAWRGELLRELRHAGFDINL